LISGASLVGQPALQAHAGVFSSLSVSISAGVSEKRATSAPEIRAEQNNNSHKIHGLSEITERIFVSFR